MPDEMSYRSLVIRAAPMELQAGGWGHEGYIIDDQLSLVFEAKISAEGSSETREQAVEAIFAAGRRLINKRLDG